MHPLARAAALSAMPILATASAQEGIAWHTDLDAARALAAEQHKPMLLLFRCER